MFDDDIDMEEHVDTTPVLSLEHFKSLDMIEGMFKVVAVADKTHRSELVYGVPLDNLNPSALQVVKVHAPILSEKHPNTISLEVGKLRKIETDVLEKFQGCFPQVMSSDEEHWKWFGMTPIARPISLEDIIREAKKDMPKAFLANVFEQIALIFQELARIGVEQRDHHPKNFLFECPIEGLAGMPTMKVVDFGGKEGYGLSETTGVIAMFYGVLEVVGARTSTKDEWKALWNVVDVWHGGTKGNPTFMGVLERLAEHFPAKDPWPASDLTHMKQLFEKLAVEKHHYWVTPEQVQAAIAKG